MPQTIDDASAESTTKWFNPMFGVQIGANSF
jgi:hypothetical protein